MNSATGYDRRGILAINPIVPVAADCAIGYLRRRVAAIDTTVAIVFYYAIGYGRRGGVTGDPH